MSRIVFPVLALGLLVAPMVSAADSGFVLVEGGVERTAGGRVAGTDGATFELSGGVRVVFAPRTEATIAPQSQLLALWPGKRTPTHSVFLRHGRVEVEIPDSSVGRTAVVVAVPDETRVLIRSGRSTVRSTPGNLLAACESGLVSVSEGARYRSVPAGKVRVVTHAGSKDHDLLPPPPVRAPSLRIAAQDPVALAGYGWGPVPGAGAYEAEIRDRTHGRRIGRTVTSAQDFPQDSPRLVPGAYELCVRAVDQFGMAGQARTALTRVVGLELPDGATVQPNHRVELELGQSVQLTFAQGLHVAFARGSGVLEPTEPIKLLEDHATTVAVRTSPQGAPELVTLVPRKTAMMAHAGPKDAVWPVDPLELEVRSFGTPAAKLPPTPPARVLLGTEPIEAAWRRFGNEWRARIAPRPGRGPCVVRLEVYNQYGAVVARDSVEVVRLPGSK